MQSSNRSRPGYLARFGLAVVLVLVSAVTGCTDQVLSPIGKSPTVTAQQPVPVVPEYSSSDVEAQVAPAAPSDFNVEVVSYGKGKNKGATVRFTWTSSASGVDAFWIFGTKSDKSTVWWAPAGATSFESTWDSGTWDFYIRTTGTNGLSSEWVGPVTLSVCGGKGPCK